jgi:hypothetical protein
VNEPSERRWSFSSSSIWKRSGTTGGLQGSEPLACRLVLRAQPLLLLRRERSQAVGVEIVLQVGELHSACKGVLRDALDERAVALALALGKGLNRTHDRLVEGALAKLVKRHPRVLHDVVEESDDAFTLGTEPERYAKWVEDVRLASFVALPPVPIRREDDRVLDGDDTVHLHGLFDITESASRHRPRRTSRRCTGRRFRARRTRASRLCPPRSGRRRSSREVRVGEDARIEIEPVGGDGPAHVEGRRACR